MLYATTYNTLHGPRLFLPLKMLKTEGPACRLLSLSELDALRLDMREASRWMRAELRRRRTMEEQGGVDAKCPRPFVGVVHHHKCR